MRSVSAFHHGHSSGLVLRCRSSTLRRNPPSRKYFVFETDWSRGVFSASVSPPSFKLTFPCVRSFVRSTAVVHVAAPGSPRRDAFRAGGPSPAETARLLHGLRAPGGVQHVSPHPAAAGVVGRLPGGALRALVGRAAASLVRSERGLRR